ncbi:MAG: adenosylmethionine--8-amino-7-oxononanoate transaminase [Gemmataceae bacterium]|nr:adenosylmethionine--8-amino-7-oxononanoate transaminase [Gemmataceae bacterium]
MNDIIVLGTDTDAGKTTFSLMLLAQFADRFDYWKPVETGDSDSQKVASLVPHAVVHPPVMRCIEPVAPPLAAKREGRSIPLAVEIVKQRPTSRPLLIETFGSPFSPLNETELQVELIRGLANASSRFVLVSSAKLGAVGRTLQTIAGLEHVGVHLHAVVLMGDIDAYAEATIRQHRTGLIVVSLAFPKDWTADAIASSAEEHAGSLSDIVLDGGRNTRLCTGQPLTPNPSPQRGEGSLIERDAAVVWHPYTALRGVAEPLACVGAEAEFLHLADGRTLIDGISSWWTILHGHRHPPLMQALREASESIDHVLFAGVTHPWGVELAERLLHSVGWASGRVFYSDNGSTAVEVALKMAYQYWSLKGEPQRTRFIGFENSYHGDTFGAMAVSRDPIFFGTFEPLLCQADILPLDPNRLSEHLKMHGSQTAAVIIEPLVQGAGGMRMHSAETLRQLREVAAEHGVLFIVDEVMTGGGRTGTLWAHQAAGIQPDLVCAAKTLAGGVLPLAATLVSAKVVSPFETDDRRKTFFHGHSFTAHPLACAVACANFRLLAAQDFLAQLQRIAAFWERSLGSLRDHPKVRDVRIQGSIAAIERKVEGGYLAHWDEQTYLADGVFLRPLGSVLYAMPPLRTSDESLDRIAAVMRKSLQ